MARITLFAAALIASANASAAPFNLVEFFRGHTQGDGVLKAIFKSPYRIKVDGFGRSEPDGSLLLKQVIHEEGKAPRTRYWRMHQAGPNRFTGTLSDASGPVRVDVNGQQVRIRYTDRDHLSFDQVLTPAGPNEVHNAMRVRRFGITVARLDEVIHKLD